MPSLVVFGLNGVVSPTRCPATGSYPPFSGWKSSLCVARRQRFTINGFCFPVVLPPGLGLGNSSLAWAHIFAQAHNVSQCWMCAELPMEATGLSWCITPATTVNWTWLHSWNTTDNWEQRWKAVDTLLCRGHRNVCWAILWTMGGNG